MCLLKVSNYVRLWADTASDFFFFFPASDFVDSAPYPFCMETHMSNVEFLSKALHFKDFV